MTREQIVDILNAAFSRRYNSVAQYILHANPYVRREDGALLQCIEELAAQDGAATEQLARTIEALEGIPQIVPYSHDVAEFNYLSLAYLSGILEKCLREEADRYESQLAQLRDCPRAREALGAVRQTIERQADKLCRLRASKPEAEGAVAPTESPGRR